MPLRPSVASLPRWGVVPASACRWRRSRAARRERGSGQPDAAAVLVIQLHLHTIDTTYYHFTIHIACVSTPRTAGGSNSCTVSTIVRLWPEECILYVPAVTLPLHSQCALSDST